MTVDKEYKLKMIGEDIHRSTMGVLAKIQELTIVAEEKLAIAAEVNEKHKEGHQRIDALLVQQAVLDAANGLAKLQAMMSVLSVNPMLRMYEDLVEKEIDQLFVTAIENKLREVDKKVFTEQARLNEANKQEEINNERSSM